MPMTLYEEAAHTNIMKNRIEFNLNTFFNYFQYIEKICKLYPSNKKEYNEVIDSLGFIEDSGRRMRFNKCEAILLDRCENHKAHAFRLIDELISFWGKPYPPIEHNEDDSLALKICKIEFNKRIFEITMDYLN